MTDMTNGTKPAIESPCIQVCVIDLETKLCIGCGRTGDEIAGWLSYSPDKRGEITSELSDRLTNLTRNKRRKGRARRRRRDVNI